MGGRQVTDGILALFAANRQKRLRLQKTGGTSAAAAARRTKNAPAPFPQIGPFVTILWRPYDNESAPPGCARLPSGREGEVGGTKRGPMCGVADWIYRSAITRIAARICHLQGLEYSGDICHEPRRGGGGRLVGPGEYSWGDMHRGQRAGSWACLSAASEAGS